MNVWRPLAVRNVPGGATEKDFYDLHSIRQIGRWKSRCRNC